MLSQSQHLPVDTESLNSFQKKSWELSWHWNFTIKHIWMILTYVKFPHWHRSITVHPMFPHMSPPALMMSSLASLCGGHGLTETLGDARTRQWTLNTARPQIPAPGLPGLPGAYSAHLTRAHVTPDISTLVTIRMMGVVETLVTLAMVRWCILWSDTELHPGVFTNDWTVRLVHWQLGPDTQCTVSTLVQTLHATFLTLCPLCATQCSARRVLVFINDFPKPFCERGEYFRKFLRLGLLGWAAHSLCSGARARGERRFWMPNVIAEWVSSLRYLHRSLSPRPGISCGIVIRPTSEPGP